MILASHQPNFFPYLGFFYNMHKADVFVFSSDVKFAKKNFQNYTNIKSTTGEMLRLTVPIKNKDVPYGEVEVADNFDLDYRRKILKTIEQNYGKTPHFNSIFPLVQDVFYQPYLRLVDINFQSIKLLKALLGINTPCVWADNLNCKGHKDERILNLCKSAGADVYLSGQGAKVYHRDENFTDVKLIYTDYKPFEYKQYKGDFIENLSALDYLFNCGVGLPKEWQNGK